MKRGEVVNSRNQTARVLPDHSAIAWNVQKVQTQTPGNGWKFGVMPKDIFYWRTEFFRNRHEPHVVAGEIEKREIIFQDEQRELVLVRVRDKSFDQREDVLRNAGFAALNDGGGEADFHRPAFRSLNDGN